MKLSAPQIALLKLLTHHPVYVTRWTRADRVALRAVERGIAARLPGSGERYEIRITQAGIDEANRRGIPVYVQPFIASETTGDPA